LAINPPDWDPVSSWTEGGAAVPFMPDGWNNPFEEIRALYEKGLAASAAHQDAFIPVDRINGPILTRSSWRHAGVRRDRSGQRLAAGPGVLGQSPAAKLNLGQAAEQRGYIVARSRDEARRAMIRRSAVTPR
jgi:hypothetical protein